MSLLRLGVGKKRHTAVPRLNNITLRYGDRTTPSDSSTVLLKNIPGLIAENSTPIVAWRTGGITASGGGAVGDWGGFLATNTDTATARTPNPTKGSITSLSTITLTGSYAYTVTGIDADGAEATATVTVEVVADAFNVGDVNPAWAMSGRFATIAAGLTWLFSAGWDRDEIYTLQYIKPAGGRLTVKMADPAKPIRMSGLEFYDCQRIDVDGLVVGGTPRNRFMVSSGSQDITIRNCRSPEDASPNYIYWPSPNSHSIFHVDYSSDVLIEDNEFHYCGRPMKIGGATWSGDYNVKNVTIRRNKFRTYWADAVNIGGSQYVNVSDNVFIAPMRNAGNTDHIDGVQFTPNAADNITVERNVWVQGEGNAGSTAFMNSNSDGVTNLAYRNNLVLSRAASSLNTGLSGSLTAAEIEDNTFFLTMSGKIAQNAASENDNVWNGVQNLVLAAQSGCQLNRMLMTGDVGGSPAGWTKSDNLGLNIAYTAIKQFTYVAGQENYEPEFLPTGTRTYDFSSVFNYADAFERLNNYHPVDNPVGTNYDALSIDQIVARILAVLTPKSGGAADLGGSVIGAITLDGQLKPTS